jgi:hypothetical protein
MSGGCSTQNLQAVSNCYFLDFENIQSLVTYNSLNVPRYGHVSVCINNKNFVMGGFDHKDDEMNNPNTLKSCEMSESNGQWVQIAPMISERAYFSIAAY